MLQEYTAKGLHAWLLPQLLTLPSISTASRVLDLGCGTGAWLERMLACGFHDLAGIDRSKDFAASNGIRFIQGDFNHPNSLDLPAFDLITAIEIIEHVANPEALIALAADHLRPSGWLVITSPNIYALRARLRFLFSSKLSFFEHNFNPEHIHPIVLGSFKRVILPKYPLSLTHTISYPAHGSDGSRLSSRIAERILTPIFGNPLPGDLLCLFLQRH